MHDEFCGLHSTAGKNQTCSNALLTACEAAGQPLTLRMQTGYDHGYYCIATFMEDHIKHHGEVLCD